MKRIKLEFSNEFLCCLLLRAIGSRGNQDWSPDQRHRRGWDCTEKRLVVQERTKFRAAHYPDRNTVWWRPRKRSTPAGANKPRHPCDLPPAWAPCGAEMLYRDGALNYICEWSHFRRLASASHDFPWLMSTCFRFFHSTPLPPVCQDTTVI